MSFNFIFYIYYNYSIVTVRVKHPVYHFENIVILRPATWTQQFSAIDRPKVEFRPPGRKPLKIHDVRPVTDRRADHVSGGRARTVGFLYFLNFINSLNREHKKKKKCKKNTRRIVIAALTSGKNTGIVAVLVCVLNTITREVVCVRVLLHVLRVKNV